MDISGVTIGLPVSQLDKSVGWYRSVFEVTAEPVTPVEGMVELTVGPVELQLYQPDQPTSAGNVVVRFGVADAAAERERIAALGTDVGELASVPGLIDWFDLSDPDGHRLSIYSLAPDA